MATMAAEWQSRMSAITPVRRYFHWRGKQWPLIGICLPRFAPIDRVAEPKSVHAAWNDCAAAAATACLDLVATPLLADAAAIARASLESVAVAMLPYLVALFAMMFLLVVVPEFTMWLPKAWGFVQ